jgi:hypothetical protein
MVQGQCLRKRIPWNKTLLLAFKDSVLMCNCHQERLSWHAREGSYISGHTVLHMLVAVRPSLIQPGPVTMWLPCVWPPQEQENGLCVQVDEDVRAMLAQWFQQQARNCFADRIHLRVSKRCLPQYKRELLLKASSSSPRTISKWVSFEQSSYNYKYCYKSTHSVTNRSWTLMSFRMWYCVTWQAGIYLPNYMVSHFRRL